MIDHAIDIGQTLASLLAAIAILGGVGFAGAWTLTRRVPCNPYGVGGQRCCADCGGRNG